MSEFKYEQINDRERRLGGRERERWGDTHTSEHQRYLDPNMAGQSIQIHVHVHVLELQPSLLYYVYFVHFAAMVGHELAMSTL